MVRAPTNTDLFLFTRQLATMLGAGIPLLRALETLRSQATNSSLGIAISDCITHILEGHSLSEALNRHRQIFSTFYCSLVAAGERAGILESSLDTLASSIQASQALKKEIRGAMLYPILVVTVLAIVVSFLLIWVIPTFEELFAEAGASIPWLTQVVLTTSRCALEYGPHLLGAALAIAFAITFCGSHNAQIRRRFDGMIARAPYLHRMIRARAAAQTTQTLAALTRAGIPILEALAITSEVVTNTHIQEDLRKIRFELGNGLSLSTAFARCHLFPPMLAHMIEIGEESGRLEEMLHKAALFFEEELRRALQTLMQAAEPLLVTLVGLVVGIFVVALYLPIFELGSLAGH
jgi:type IV pilus assembly protein PilC